MEVIEHLHENSHIVVNGFKHAGIHQALGILTNKSDLSIYSDDCNEYSDESKSNKDGLLDVTRFYKGTQYWGG